LLFFVTEKPADSPVVPIRLTDEQKNPPVFNNIRNNNQLHLTTNNYYELFIITSYRAISCLMCVKLVRVRYNRFIFAS